MTPTIAGFTLLGELGRGGFGVVHRARQDSLGRVVAVKLLPGVAGDDESFARFRRECQALGAVGSHPNIATVHACGVADDGSGYLAMELLEGGTLAARTAKDPLPWHEVATVGVALAGALETAHRVGVLHRDIKPENVIFDGLGTPKLLDFGIASVPGAFQSRSQAVSLTLAHAAPEVLVGGRGSQASDVYSLASTLYAAVHGAPAFVRADEETLVPLLARIAADPVPDLRPDGIPDDLCTLLERALEKDPAVRPLSAEAFGIALAAVVAAHGGVRAAPPVLAPPAEGVAALPVLPQGLAPGEPTMSRAPQPAERRRRASGLVVAACLAGLVVGGAVVYRAMDPGPPVVTGGPAAVVVSSPPAGGPTATAARGSKPGGSADKVRKTPKAEQAQPVSVVVSSPVTKPRTQDASHRSGTSSHKPDRGDNVQSVPPPATGSTPPVPPPSSPPASSPRPARPAAPVDTSAEAVATLWGGSRTTPTAVRVTLSWAAGAGGGEVRRYQVRRTLLSGGVPVQAPVRFGRTGMSVVATVPALRDARQWYRWQVRSVGPGGRSAWSPVAATLPDLMGARVAVAVAKVRAVGLAARVHLVTAPQRVFRGRVYAQSLPAGDYVARTLVELEGYGRRVG